MQQQHDQKQLHEIARENPCYMFTGEEICVLCNVSQNVVSRVKAHTDSPFFLNKCRPEWFLEFMRNHPEFQLTKAAPLPPSKCQPSKDPASAHNRKAGRGNAKDPCSKAQRIRV